MFYDVIISAGSISSQTSFRTRAQVGGAGPVAEHAVQRVVAIEEPAAAPFVDLDDWGSAFHKVFGYNDNGEPDDTAKRTRSDVKLTLLLDENVSTF